MPSACNRLRNPGITPISEKTAKQGQCVSVDFSEIGVLFWGLRRFVRGCKRSRCRLKCSRCRLKFKRLPNVGLATGNCGRRVVRGRSALETSGLWVARSGVALKCCAAALNIAMVCAKHCDGVRPVRRGHEKRTGCVLRGDC